MVGLNHDFMIIESETFSLNNYEEYQETDHVEIHDDLLRYFADSISWVSSYNPCKEENTTGLCWYGSTLILPESVGKFESIISGWLLIFSEAPGIMTLKGGWFCSEGDPPDSGSYEKLSFRKIELVEKLSKLISYCESIRVSGGRRCLLHLGI
ncbi:hypothetical protein MNBD_GAMMA12-5 [hydrothermal vent metagenome]|uniref:Uncharacterized protein n=1 Tax=hydrothermal vent metagenome TaxID=652676 RepID=A0A3B0YK28_9ZZZZ